MKTEKKTATANMDGAYSDLVREHRKRHRKNSAARKKRLDRIAKKYAGMAAAEIEEHNMKMIDRRDDLIDRRDDAL